MINELRPYPEYRDSGLPWLGNIPQHWDCLPHRAVFEEIKEQGHVNEPLLSVTIGRGIIRQKDLLADSSMKDSSNLDKSKYKLVEPGDIAYNKMRAWQGALGVSRYRGIVSPAYIVQRLRGALKPDYFHYLFRTSGFAKEAERWSYGITSDQWSLRSQHFKMIYSCVPPLEEQELIVGFLREFNRQVHRFVSNRQRLIEVLNEQKQAIINRAVTSGLNPNAPLKPTGIDWLGDIPEHWEACRLKHILSRSLTYGANAAAEFSDRNFPRYIRITDIDKSGRLKNDSFRSLPPNVAEPYILQDGDILLARSGATVGKSFLYSSEKDGHAAHAGYLINTRVDQKKVLSEYLYVCLQSGRYWQWIASMTIQATIQNVSAEKYSNLWIPVPPVDEQLSIIESVKNETALPMALSSIAQREIDLIREYRTRLISDVVTGKVDVRHLAPSPGREDLAEMSEALKPLEEDITEDMIDEEEPTY